jgi:hypothetical protein
MQDSRYSHYNSGWNLAALGIGCIAMLMSGALVNGLNSCYGEGCPSTGEEAATIMASMMHPSS